MKSDIVATGAKVFRSELGFYGLRMLNSDSLSTYRRALVTP